MIRIICNTVVVYAVLMLLMRLTGKRQLGELELSELIVTILISEVASQPLQDPDVSLLRAFAPVLALMGIEYLLSAAAMKSVRFRAVLAGKPALLVVRGRIDQTQMRKNRITPDELAEALRDEGILDMNDVEFAILETNGRLNIIPTPGERTVTAGQLGLSVSDGGYPVMIINNGRVLTENLRVLGRDEAWLKKKLAEHGLTEPRQVYMMTSDMADGIFISPAEDR